MSRQWVIANDQPGPDKINYGKVSRKKVAVLLDFVQITSTLELQAEEQEA